MALSPTLFTKDSTIRLDNTTRPLTLAAKRPEANSTKLAYGPGRLARCLVAAALIGQREDARERMCFRNVRRRLPTVRREMPIAAAISSWVIS